MRKSKVKCLIVLIVLIMMFSVGCNSTNIKTNNDSGEKVYTIGINQLADHPALDDARQGFEDGLRELGVNAKIIYQNAQGEIPNTIMIAQKFVKNNVDLIYAIATPAAQSTKQITSDIPILFSAVTDPVKSEIVIDWKNVGGNITGTSDMANTDSQLKMFKEIDPNIKTIGILYNTDEANSEIQIEEVEKLTPYLGLEVVKVGVNNINDLPQAIDSLFKKIDALYILSDNMVASSIELVSTKLIESNMISVSAEESQVKGGALITNGLSYYELGKQTATMAKKVLVDKKNISTIPVELAEKTITKINGKTLEALGLDYSLPLFKNAIKAED